MHLFSALEIYRFLCPIFLVQVGLRNLGTTLLRWYGSTQELQHWYCYSYRSYRSPLSPTRMDNPLESEPRFIMTRKFDLRQNVTPHGAL